ncbi:unnamed protein product [Clonostachys solani]|uniref:Uncharacterized protein n=1 Tax=Clonostachys solani TaxID=160281 RepID=A0A9P0ESN9_9HYPO|nr:unnamed protein product [Clonostachys solani]
MALKSALELRRLHPSKMLGNHIFEPRWTPLCLAIYSDNMEAAEFLLLKGAPPILDVEGQMGILHVACMTNHASALKWAVEMGYDTELDAFDSRGKAPLDYASLYRNWDCFRLMISYGADVNSVVVWEGLEDNPDEDPLQQMLYDAIYSGRFKDALDLLDTGVNPDLPIYKDDVSLLNLLCQVPWSGNDSWSWGDDDDERRLNDCSDFISDQRHALALIKNLMSLGLDIQDICREYTPLSAAAECGNILAARHLIKLGASVDGKPGLVFTPLGRACTPSRANSDMASLLLDSGASVHRPYATSCPPLWTKEPNPVRTCQQQEVMIDLLMEKGAGVLRGTSSGDSTHYTPLESLLFRKEVQRFKSLLARCQTSRLGTDDLVGFWKMSRPLDALHPEITALILDLDTSGVISHVDTSALAVQVSGMAEGNKMSVRNAVVLKLLNQDAPLIGTSLLRDAIEYGASPVVIRNLLAKGADPNQKSEQERTILRSVLENKLLSQENKRAYTRCLLDAGVSIYENAGPRYISPRIFSLPFVHVRYAAGSRPTQNQRKFQADQIRNAATLQLPEPPEESMTHLGLAISQGRAASDIVDLMLESQPLRDHPSEIVYAYLNLAIHNCNMGALQAIAKSTDTALVLVREHASRFIHELLDYKSEATTSRDIVDAASATVDCLEMVSESSKADWSCVPLPSTTGDRTAGEKLLAIISEDHPLLDNSYGAALSRSCRQRIRFMADDLRPTFLRSPSR